MYHFPIGVILDSFKKSIPESLKLAQDMGAQGIQVYATYGELSPKNLTGAKRREFLDMVKDHGLVISALCEVIIMLKIIIKIYWMQIKI